MDRVMPVTPSRRKCVVFFFSCQISRSSGSRQCHHRTPISVPTAPRLAAGVAEMGPRVSRTTTRLPIFAVNKHVLIICIVNSCIRYFTSRLAVFPPPSSHAVPPPRPSPPPPLPAPSPLALHRSPCPRAPLRRPHHAHASLGPAVPSSPSRPRP